MAPTQEASFEYLEWSELYEYEKPYEVFLDNVFQLNGVKRTNLEFKRGPVQQAHDVRGDEQKYSLDVHGFTWIDHSFNSDDLRQEETILLSYLPAMERLIEHQVEGADKVVIFDWRLRLSTTQEEFESKTIDLNNSLDPLRPAIYPHVDQTPEGSISRAYHHLKNDAEELLKGRFRIINVWRPLTVVENWPLAVCDARSVAEDDLIASDFVRRQYQGETYFAVYNDAHRWHFMSRQKPDEPLLFKVYDSSEDVEAKCMVCLHASFPIEDSQPRPPRESIECRALVFTDPTVEVQDAPARPKSAEPLIPKQSPVYGTAWKQLDTANCTLSAIEAGFRAFDTAAQPRHYNEALFGQAIQQAISSGLVTRDQLWIQTKFSNIDGQDLDNIPYDPLAPIADQIRSSIEQSLASIAATGKPAEAYLDCVLLHSPLATIEETYEAWDALSSFVPDRVRCLGISNIAVTALSMLYDRAPVKPCVVQNRFCKRTNHDASVRQFCRNRGVIYQGFGLLKDDSDLLKSAPVQQLAEAVDISREQAIFALAIAIEVLPLDGTTSEDRMRGDLKALETVATWRSSEIGGRLWPVIKRDFEAMVA